MHLNNNRKDKSVVLVETLVCVCWVTPNFWENALIAEKKLLLF